MTPYPPRSQHLGRKRRKEDHSDNKKVAWEWAKVIGLAVIIAVVIRIFLFEPFDVSGPSMENTMHTGNIVMVNKLIYKFGEPERGEIVVFHVPGSEQKDFVKRVVALPGEKVEVKNSKLIVDDKIIEEPYLSENMRTMDFEAVTVPQGHLFVLGDNRANSTDSRSHDLGPIPIDSIIGRADLIYWPLSQFEFLW
ncbi:signal peptidase I [Hazenella coriacea]|uniref:Signal peptidase I n=1 Tax=Hazenella coriacea TaxID=1179467 RepID=A0A4V2UUU3_9BACL|nr:signal peptidase I [Hazenella coriacea]TCS93127.1 signal peptidase I [Hazenella coriacea]